MRPNFASPGLAALGARSGAAVGSPPGEPTGQACGVSASVDVNYRDYLFFIPGVQREQMFRMLPCEPLVTKVYQYLVCV